MQDGYGLKVIKGTLTIFIFLFYDAKIWLCIQHWIFKKMGYDFVFYKEACKAP